MEVYLRGSSPCATTAAILLMTKARQMGLHLFVRLVGDPSDIAVLHGPAVLFSPVLASCGIGRDLGSGATVVVPGPPEETLYVSLSENGLDSWFRIDRNGQGAHPATEAYVRLSRDPRIPARKLAKDLRRLMDVLGMSSDPAVLDILFGAPSPPLTRLSLALRTGRALSGGRGEPITRFLSGAGKTLPPLSPKLDPEAFFADLREGRLHWLLEGLGPALRDLGEEWFESAVKLAEEDQGRDLALLHGLAEILSHLAHLPTYSILPPLSAADDAVAMGIKAGLAAVGDENPSAQLRQMFQFLGGKYASEAQYAYEAELVPPPSDPVERWRWFCAQAEQGRKWADQLWPIILDPPQ